MRTHLLIAGILLVSFSCKKADPAKALEEVGAEPPATASPANPGVFNPYTTHTKTILASTTGTLNNLVVTNNMLYIVGNYSSLGGASSRCITTYDGISFGGVSNNLLSGSSINTVKYFNGGRLLIGGVFTTTANSNTRYFAYISSGSISTYSGVIGSVNCFQDFGSDCVMGGAITSVSSSAGNAANYSTSYSLTYYGSSLFSAVPVTNAMANYNGVVFMGGSYSSSTERYIVYNSSSSWQKSGNGFNNAVYDLEVYNGKLYAGGNMSYDGNLSVPLNYVNYTGAVGGNWAKAGTTNLPAFCKSLETHGSTLVAACNNGTTGYLYCYDQTANNWVNCVNGSMSLYRLDKVESFGGKLYGIEKNTATGVTNFVRFD